MNELRGCPWDIYLLYSLVLSHPQSQHHSTRKGTIMANAKASVRISGKKGKISVNYDPSKTTLAEVINEAVASLGLEGFNTNGTKVLVDGVETDPTETVPEGAQKIDVAPQARLG